MADERRFLTRFMFISELLSDERKYLIQNIFNE